ncbi:RHS repeat-associated core domain-containing protein, partial [Serratia fonticola]
TSKTVEGRTTEYLWQGNKLIAETDNQQHWQTFLYEPGSHRPMATIVGSTRVNSPKVRTYWYQNDHLGTPHSLTDSQGNTVWRGQYSAYGQLTEEWTQPDDPYGHPQPKVNNPLRFQGQYEDAESGLYYNLNRYYDPGIGRYLTADPIGLAGGINGYQYCLNPISYIDPLGLFKIEQTGFETYYRTMSQEHYEHLLTTGRLKGTSETFISPTQGFSEGYLGNLVELNLNEGATEKLVNIGVRDTSLKVKELYPEMPTVSSGWKNKNAYFKKEDDQINIGLGTGYALDLFNENITSINLIKKINKLEE